MRCALGVVMLRPHRAAQIVERETVLFQTVP